MNIEDKAVELMEKLDKLATEYAPDVIDSAIEVVRVSGFGSLIYGLLAVGFIFSLWLAYKKIKSYEIDSAYEEPIWGGFFLVSIVGGVISVVVIIETLFDIWTWVAIFNPKLALAHQILGL